MTIAFVEFEGTPSYIACNGGGIVMMARTKTTMTAAATSPLAALVTAMGAPGGKVIGASFCKSDADLEVSGGGNGIAPYVDYANQDLEWRDAVVGTAGVTPAVQGVLVLDLVVLV